MHETNLGAARPPVPELGSFARFRQLHSRLLVSIACGALVVLALMAVPLRMTTRLLVGWDAGLVLYLMFVFRTMAHSTVDNIRRRAALLDEGAIALLVLTTAAALASLVAVVAELGHAPSWQRIVMGVITILLSWTFMHLIFALHYAHEYYGAGADDRVGGLVFPGDEDPDYWDFVYYSFVVAMTAQVSDVQITSKAIRRLSTAHGVVAFFFNATVLALTVNIVSGLM